MDTNNDTNNNIDTNNDTNNNIDTVLEFPWIIDIIKAMSRIKRNLAF